MLIRKNLKIFSYLTPLHFDTTQEDTIDLLYYLKGDMRIVEV